MEKQRVTVMVAGQKFTLITDEEEKYVIDVAAKIDARVSSIAMSQNMTRERAAVLTALDVADDNERLKRDTADVKEQIKDYIASLAELQQKNAELTQQNAALAELQQQNAELEQQNAKFAELEKQNAELTQQNAALSEEIESLKAALDEAKKAAKSAPAAVKAAEEIAAPAPAKTPAPAPAAVPDASPAAEEAPAPIPDDNDAPAIMSEPIPEITADDDLPFDEPVEASAPRPKKKQRHEHKHENPYKQQYAKKQEQKGYTPQRQYSLFDLND